MVLAKDVLNLIVGRRRGILSLFSLLLRRGGWRVEGLRGVLLAAFALIALIALCELLGRKRCKRLLSDGVW